MKCMYCGRGLIPNCGIACASCLHDALDLLRRVEPMIDELLMTATELHTGKIIVGKRREDEES